MRSTLHRAQTSLRQSPWTLPVLADTVPAYSRQALARVPLVATQSTPAKDETIAWRRPQSPRLMLRGAEHLTDIVTDERLKAARLSNILGRRHVFPFNGALEHQHQRFASRRCASYVPKLSLKRRIGFQRVRIEL